MQIKDKYNVAVAGATGAVGQEMIRILEERNFPAANIRLLASERSEGKILKFQGQEVRVEKLNTNFFSGVDIALFSAGASRSKEFAPSAVKAGAVVIDNSSAFRMDKEVPLIVPEVNPHHIPRHKGIIANPNCSTIQLVVAATAAQRDSNVRVRLDSVAGDRVVAATGHPDSPVVVRGDVSGQLVAVALCHADSSVSV